MNKYETVFIFDPDASETEQQAVLDRIRSLINDQRGKLLVFDDWGVRRFAYEIQKKKQGRYVRLEYAGSGDLVHEIERFFRIDHRVLKFLTIRLARNIDPESLAGDDKEAETTSMEQPEGSYAEAEPSPPEAPPEAAEGEEGSGGGETAETETDSEEKES